MEIRTSLSARAGPTFRIRYPADIARYGALSHDSNAKSDDKRTKMYDSYPKSHDIFTKTRDFSEVTYRSASAGNMPIAIQAWRATAASEMADVDASASSKVQ
jgi:TRAP-type mannitol/chloroaromatic compound transport system substrate-binding protein